MSPYSRADFLKLLINKKSEDSAASARQVNNLSDKSSGGIGQYKGQWGRTQIMHLLRRTLFGVSLADYDYFSKMSLSECLTVLLTPSPVPSPPLNTYNHSEFEPSVDPQVPAGETWVNAPYILDIPDTSRRLNLKAWWVGLMLNQDRSLTEKMTLFWHNHFTTEISVVRNAQFSYRYLSLLRNNAFGNFKTLTKAITTDPSMLVYLNGDTNIVGAPNENYARELQELFTIGKGTGMIAPYTESDVEMAAKVLTGWSKKMDNTSIFIYENHDSSDKTFSSFYEEAVIKGESSSGANETDQLINMIFDSPQSKLEAAKFLCRNLYRWFVYYKIDETIETNVIAPLAQVVINNDFEVAPVLRTLLSSEHFFDAVNMGCYIKSPVEFVVGLFKQFSIQIPGPSSASDITGLTNQYNAWLQLETIMANMALDPGDPPNVAGWAAYYEAPVFNRLWLNSDTLPLRNKITDSLLTKSGATFKDTTLAIDCLTFTGKLSNPSDPHQLIADSTFLLSSNSFGPVETSIMLKILISGQTNASYWTHAWNEYISNPTDDSAKSIVETRLRQYYTYLLERAEYQLI